MSEPNKHNIFDFEALMKHEVKSNIEVIEVNELNIDKAAEVFYNWLRR